MAGSDNGKQDNGKRMVDNHNCLGYFWVVILPMRRIDTKIIKTYNLSVDNFNFYEYTL